MISGNAEEGVPLPSPGFGERLLNHPPSLFAGNPRLAFWISYPDSNGDLLTVDFCFMASCCFWFLLNLASAL